MRKSAMKCGRRRIQPLLMCLHPGNGAVWVIYSQICQSRHTKRTLTSHIIKADKMATVLRGGNIGEEPFFFEGDGAFISGDLVKPELCLRKDYMIAPAVSSPDRIGKNVLIDRDYSDVFTACSSSSFAESRNPFTSRFFRFPCSRLLSSFTVPFQRMEYLAGCSSHSFKIFIASQAARHARSSPVLSVAHSPVIRLVITARMEALRISCR